MSFAFWNLADCMVVLGSQLLREYGDENKIKVEQVEESLTMTQGVDGSCCVVANQQKMWKVTAYLLISSKSNQVLHLYFSNLINGVSTPQSLQIMRPDGLVLFAENAIIKQAPTETIGKTATVNEWEIFADLKRI